MKRTGVVPCQWKYNGKQLDCKWSDSVNDDDFEDAFLNEWSDYVPSGFSQWILTKERCAYSYGSQADNRHSKKPKTAYQHVIFVRYVNFRKIVITVAFFIVDASIFVCII